MKIAVLDAGTLGFDRSAWSAFEALGELVLHEGVPADSSAVAECVGDAEAVFTNKAPLGRDVFEACPGLRFVGVLATGYNVIDLEAASAHRVTVCNVPSYATETTAQHAVALGLELCNQVGRHCRSVAEGDWIRSPRFSYWKQAPAEVAGMTVGVVGMGAIGRRVANIYHALGAGIMGSARTRRDTPELSRFAWAENAEIFAEADLVTLHCPQTEANAGFVDGALLATMKPTAFLVNASRGGLVNEADLADCLNRGGIAGAAVDVVAEEPMRPECPLLGARNSVITPHMAWASEPARRRLLELARDNLRAFLEGRPRNVVNPR